MIYKMYIYIMYFYLSTELQQNDKKPQSIPIKNNTEPQNLVLSTTEVSKPKGIFLLVFLI